jgi:heptosyltransferase-3
MWSRVVAWLRRSGLRWRQRITARGRMVGMRRQAAAAARAAAAHGAKPTAILLLERFGDIVASSGAVQALAEQGAWCVWVGRPRYRDIALRVPGVRDYLAIECYRELAEFVAGLRGWSVVDFNLNGKTCPCCNQPWRNVSGGDARIDTETYYDVGPLALAFTRVAGIALGDAAPVLLPPQARDLPPELASASPARPYLVLHSESEEAARGWRPDGWRAMVDVVLTETPWRVVHVGARAAPWLPASERVLDLAGQTHVRALLATVAGCVLFAGIDSSVAHVANAYRRPGLILLGTYRVFRRYLPYTGFYGAGGALIVHYAREVVDAPIEPVLHALRTALARLLRGDDLLGRDGPIDIEDEGARTNVGNGLARRAAPAVGDLVVAREDGCMAAIDSLSPPASNGAQTATGWAFLRRHRRPPDELALAQRAGDRFRLLAVARFSRLDREDVARAHAAPEARFCGWSVRMPSPDATDLLFHDAAADTWHRVPLP